MGAGAAGVTLARELGRSGVDVVLLESGGFEPEDPVQDLYAGRASGEVLGADDTTYLRETRQRYYGGATNTWDGWCRPLDGIDFEARPWLPHSGWPFDRGHLEPFYRRAAEVLKIDPFEPEARARAERRGPRLFPDDAPFETSYFHVSRVRFGDDYRDEMAASSRVRVLQHANLVTLEANRAGTAVDAARIATLEGARFEIGARHYVLAAGGIENARLLLLSDSVQPRGLGNEHDLVGRYFMEHAFFVSGRIALPGWRHRTELYHVGADGRGGRVQGLLRLSDARLRELELLNILFQVGRYRVRSQETLHAGVGQLARIVRMLDDGDFDEGHGNHLGPVSFACEQSPNPESRVTLADDRDALGQRRAQLAWRLTARERDSIVTTFEALGRELGVRGLGRLAHVYEASAPWSEAAWSYHHSGTTRMHDDPRRGVVDAHARVHGLANLHVAGSSVFPTCGCSNPTFTIVALTLRLADRLRDALAG